MIKVGKRNIRDGREFDQFFSKSKGDFVTVEKEATLSDTISLMKQVVRDTLEDTKKIANRLRDVSVKKTCNRIWNFCFSHFQYTKDEERKEQVRRPSRSWRDRKAGIDCDCLTVLIGSILSNLGIPFKMRMTRYQGLDFEHIYPVAETPEGEIIIDCVVHQFNYEVPYTHKKDVEMELQYLNGVEGERFNEFGDKVSFEHDLPIDAEDLFLEDMELQGLEGKAERQARKAKRKETRAEKKKIPLKTRVKEGLKKGLNVINKVNPAAMLLRGGVLASMKLNLFKVASHLRFAYWSDAEAQRNDMDMGKFQQLKSIRQKMEKIYFGAGGKADALKKAILTGKGNRNKMVQLNGLGEIINAVHDESDLRTILGEDLFYEELNGFDGLGGLGSVATGAAVAAASGVIGTISALIKKLGSLFKKGSKSEQQFQIQDNTDDAEEKTRKFSIKNIVSKVKQKIQDRRVRKGKAPASDGTDLESSEDYEAGTGLDPIEPYPEDEFILDDSLPTRAQEDDSDYTSDDSEDEESKGGFMNWIKNNKVTAGLIGAGILAGGTLLTIHLVKKSKKKKGLAGVPKTKKKKAGKFPKRKVTKRKFVPRSRGRNKTATKRKTTNSVSRVELL